MNEIDKPFRFTWDFCIVWGFLAIPTAILTRRLDWGEWYSDTALVIIISLFATFALYGPVLLFRQVVRSGSRGRLAVRILLSLVLVGAVFFGGLVISGFYTEESARIVAFFFVAAATAFLNWRMSYGTRT